MPKLIYKNGITGVILRVKILNSSLTTGAGLTGLTSASSGLIISTIANNEATATTYTVAGSTIETITTLGTFAAPTATKCRFKEVDATNHPGVYEIQIADARWAVSNARSVIVSVLGATNAAQVDAEIQLEPVPADVTRWLGTAPATPFTAGVPMTDLRDYAVQQLSRLYRHYANVWYVNDNGADDTGITPYTAFATISQAMTAAANGDLVVVGPGGNYDEQVVLKTGVDLHFEHGANINYTGSAGAIFAVSTAVDCKITGQGKFHATGGVNVFNVTHASANIKVEALEIVASTSGSAAAINMTAGRLEVDCEGACQSTTYDSLVINGATLIIKADSLPHEAAEASIECATGATVRANVREVGTVDHLDGTIELTAEKVTGPWTLDANSLAIIHNARFTYNGTMFGNGDASARVILWDCDLQSNPNNPATQIAAGGTFFMFGETRWTPSKVSSATVLDYSNNQNVRSTTYGNTLDVASTGEAALDFNNIKQASGATTLTNITVPVVTLTTTTTNLTNAPTNGDFTAVMKTSLNSATPAVTVSDKTGFKLASDGLALITAWTVNVTGNLSGSVGSVTAGVTVTTNNDKTGYALSGTQTFNVTGNITGNLSGSVGSVTGAVGSVTGAVGSVTGNVGGNVTGSVGSVAAGGIVSSSFAAGAINAAAIATDAIDADALKADAVTEIQSGLATASAVSGVQTDVDDIQNRLPAALVSGRMDSNVQATASALTFNLTGNVTGNLSGSVGSVTGAVGSVTGSVGGNVTGSVGSISGVTFPTGFNNLTLTNINGEVDTAIADARLDELLAADSDIDGAAPPTVGSVFHELMSKSTGSFTYDQTTDALEAVRDRGDAAWTGGGGTADWTADERTAIKTILGVPASGTTPDVPSAGALKVIDDLIDDEVQAILAKIGNPSGISVSADIAQIQSTLSQDHASRVSRLDTAMAGAASTITLDVGASSITDFYQGETIAIFAGAGIGQARRITAYNGTTKVATVERAWKTTPDNTSAFIITMDTGPKVDSSLDISGGGAGLDAPGVRAAIGMATADLDIQLEGIATSADAGVAAGNAAENQAQVAAAEALQASNYLAPAHSGTAQAGGASSITLASGASSVTDYYKGATVKLIGGTGANQSARRITAYNGTTKVATLDRAWATNPDNTSDYEVLKDTGPKIDTALQVTPDAVGSGGIGSVVIEERDYAIAD